MKFITRIKNTPEGIQCIKDMRKVAKTHGILLAVFGRAKRKEVFAKTGRIYRGNGGNNNNISLKSKEAPYCYEWVVYRKETLGEKELQRKHYEIRSLAWQRDVELYKKKL